MIAHEVNMTKAQLKKASKRILQALNDTQFVDGYTLDQVLMITLFIVGSALKKNGVVLQMDEPLRTAIQPLVRGYEIAGKHNAYH